MNGPASMVDDTVTVGNPLPRIASVTMIDGRRVRITWRDGRSNTVDLNPVLNSHRHFIPLRDDDELFGTMRVNEDGNAIEWDGESSCQPNGSIPCPQLVWRTGNSAISWTIC